MCRYLFFWNVLLLTACSNQQTNQFSDENYTSGDKVLVQNKASDSLSVNFHDSNLDYLTDTIIPSNIEALQPREFSNLEENNRYVKIYKDIFVFEESENKETEYITKRIDFYNNTKQKISSFYVDLENPYSKRKISSIVNDNYWGFTYDSFQKNDADISNEDKKQYSFINRSSHEGLPVIGYNLITSNSGIITDWIFTAICLDENGELIREFKNLPIDPVDFCLSRDGNFFCVNYGGLRGENLTKLRNSGVRIYDTRTGKIVYEENLEGNYQVTGPSPDTSTEWEFGVYTIDGNDFSNDLSSIYNVIDFGNRKIFRLKLSYEDIGSIKSVDNEGFILKTREGEKNYKLFFDKDFKIINF